MAAIFVDILCRRASVMLALACAWPIGANAQGWAPTQTIEIVVPAGAGGAIDRTARLIQALLKPAGINNTSSVVNKSGGGHSVGYAYLNQHAKDPHYLLVTSTNLVTNHVAGTSPIGYTDVTPISLLFNEYVVFCVASQSSIGSPMDLIATLKARPESISVGVGSAIMGANSVAVSLVGKAAGIDSRKLRKVTFKSSSEAAVQLMGGHIGLIASTPGVLAAGITNGQLRPLAVSAPSRLNGKLANVPTWREVGVDAIVGNWRIVIAPTGLSADAADFWSQAMARISATPAWRESLEKSGAGSDYMNRQATGAFLDEQDMLYRAIFAELGIKR